MQNDTVLYDNINAVPAVSDRKLADNAFKLFLEGCGEPVIPFVGEFRVNTHTTDFQGAPAIAIDDAGDFAITWQSGDYYNPNSPDGDGPGIFAQRYNAAGQPR
jgi:hypothetical protein